MTERQHGIGAIDTEIEPVPVPVHVPVSGFAPVLVHAFEPAASNLWKQYLEGVVAGDGWLRRLLQVWRKRAADLGLELRKSENVQACWAQHESLWAETWLVVAACPYRNSKAPAIALNLT